MLFILFALALCAALYMASPGPGPSNLIMRPDLRGAVAEEWSVTDEASEFTADQVCPLVEVPDAGGTVKRIPRETMTKDVDTKRAPGGTYSQSDLGDETFTYFTQEYGHAVPVDANLAAQTKKYYDAEVVATKMVLSKVKRDHEKNAAAKLFSTTTFSGHTTTATTPWSTHASAVPIDDIRAAKETIKKACGYWANRLVMSWKAWSHLEQCDQILNRIGSYNSEDPILARLNVVAQLLGVKDIVIAGGVKDTAKKGQDFSGDFIWDPTMCLLGFFNPAMSLSNFGLCATWHWNGDGSSPDWTVEQYYSDEVRGYKVRARRQHNIDVPYPEAGYLLTTVTA